MTGMSKMRDKMRTRTGRGGKKLNRTMEMRTTVSKKPVPQRGCSKGNRATEAGVSSAPAS